MIDQEEPLDADDQDEGTDKSVLHGFLITIALQVAGGAFLLAADAGMIFFFGILQLTWMVPAAVVAKLAGARSGFIKGMILCGVVTFLLNALCFGVAFIWLALSGPWYG